MGQTHTGVGSLHPGVRHIPRLWLLGSGRGACAPPRHVSSVAQPSQRSSSIASSFVQLDGVESQTLRAATRRPLEAEAQASTAYPVGRHVEPASSGDALELEGGTAMQDLDVVLRPRGDAPILWASGPRDALHLKARGIWDTALQDAQPPVYCLAWHILGEKHLAMDVPTVQESQVCGQ